MWIFRLNNCYFNDFLASDLDAVRLCQLTFRTMEQLMRSWFTEIPPELSVHCSTSHPHLISHHSIKNTRRKMEDRHAIIPSVNLFTDKEVRFLMFREICDAIYKLMESGW